MDAESHAFSGKGEVVRPMGKFGWLSAMNADTDPLVSVFWMHHGGVYLKQKIAILVLRKEFYYSVDDERRNVREFFPQPRSHPFDIGKH